MSTPKPCVVAKLAIVALCLLAVPTGAAGGLIGLQNPTATFEQPEYPGGLWGGGIHATIDGVIYDGYNAWGFEGGAAMKSAYQFGVYQTTSPQSPSELTFSLFFFGVPHPGTKFQDIRLSYTQSASPTVDSGALWTILTPSSASATMATAVINGDHIQFSGDTTLPDIYTVSMENLALTGVTGFRLEIYPGVDFPWLGFPNGNGNAHLTEFQVDASPVVPEPTALIVWALLGASGIGFGWWRRKRAG